MREEEYIRFLSWVKPIEENRKNEYNIGQAILPQHIETNRDNGSVPTVEPFGGNELYDPDAEYVTDDLELLEKINLAATYEKKIIFFDAEIRFEILLNRGLVYINVASFWILYLEYRRDSNNMVPEDMVLKNTKFYKLFTDRRDVIVYQNSINKPSDLPIKSICKLCNGTGKYIGFSTIEKCKCQS